MSNLTAIAVHLNTTRDASFGFRNEFSAPALAPAAVEVELNTSWLPVRGDDSAVLEYVFEQLNIGGDLVPAAPFTERYRDAGNRSLSVGDVVVVAGQAYSCERSGWAEVDEATFAAAIALGQNAPAR